MHTALQRSQRLLLAACAALLLSGCFETLNYRHIQADFNAAVAADNEVSTVPTADPVGVLTSGDAQQRYQEIEAKLSDKDIDGLDTRLQPNAYALRAVAQWRCGKLIDARASATKGLALSNVASSPRDQMVLKIIPALVIDKELVAKFRAAGRTVNEATYNTTYPKDFATSAQILKDATNTVQPGTPDAIIFYVTPQSQWRWALASSVYL